MRSPERGRPAFDRGEWASPVSSKLQKSTDIVAERQRANNPFHEESKNSVSQSIDHNFIARQNNYMDNQQPTQLASHLMTTTNFSDVLGGHYRRDNTMQRDEIVTERELLGAGTSIAQVGQDPAGKNKLDELEQLALDALDDI